MSAVAVKPKEIFVQLGRAGDIINILPLLHHHQKLTGETPHLLVAKEYHQLLEGVSYVHPVIWDGQFADLNRAMASIRHLYQHLRVTQVYGWNLAFPRRTSSFIEESWNQIGQISLWGKLNPVFDKRDIYRERSLIKRFMQVDKPNILVAASGISSPFAHSKELLTLLHHELADHNIIDLSRIKAHHFYDLLGLMDNATALITIDTGHLHLARASSVPVIALCTSGPTSWHSSPAMPGQILRLTYNDFIPRQMDIIGAIRNIKGAGKGAGSGAKASKSPEKPGVPVSSFNVSTNPSSRPLLHIYNDYPRTSDALLRHNFAKYTWAKEYSSAPWKSCPVPSGSLVRSSKIAFNDTRAMPFIKDIVNHAILTQNPSQSTILVLTNDDICFAPSLGKWLQEVTPDRAAWSNRWDFPSLTEPLDTMKIRTGGRCVGTDLFAFTRDWWQKHSILFPDMVLGCEAWDWVLREMIRDSGGFEIHAMTYHQSHSSFWQSGMNRSHNPGNRHNQGLARKWLQERQKPLRELSKLK